MIRTWVLGVAVVLCVSTASTGWAITFDRLDSEDFLHLLEFDVDGEIPSVEGAADGWAEDAAWAIDGDTPPYLSVQGGLLQFNSVLAGQQSITLEAASTWAAEVTPETSYTMEVRLRVIASDGPNGGAILWTTNGATRSIVRVDVNGVFTFSGTQLDDGDNSTDFVTIRVAYHAPSGTYFIWRNDVLIGNGVPNDGAAAGGRIAVFLIDCCSTVQVEGEFDYVRWDASGAYAPAGGDATPPAAPTGLTAQPEDGRVLLDWDDNSDPDVACYNLYRSETSGGPYDLLQEELFASEFIDEAVVNGTTYYYVARALDVDGNESGPSDETEATPGAGLDVTPPATPTGLVASAGSGSVFLDWDDNFEDDLAGYVLRRSETSGGPYTEIAGVNELGVGASEFEDSNVVLQTRYYYTLAAADLTGNESDPTAEVSAILTIDISAEVEKDSSEFGHALEFNQDGVPPSVEGADDLWVETGAWNPEGEEPPFFKIEGGVATWDTAGLGQGGGRFFDFQQPNGNSAWSSEIAPSVSYTFEVRLRVTGGVEGVANGGVDNPGASIWLANGVGRSLTVVRTDQIRWDIDPGVVLHSGDNSTEFVTVRVVHDGPMGQYYIFRDRALIAGGVDAPAGDARSAVFLIDFGASSESAGEFDYVRWDSTGAYWPPTDPADTTPPAPPTGLAAVAEESRVTLSWDASGEDDLGGYNLSRSETSGGPYTVIARTGATEYADDDVENGVTYYYVLSAVDINRNVSDPSDEVDATPEAGIDLTPPAPPTGLDAVVTAAAEVALSWDLGQDIDLATYNVWRAEVSGGPYDVIAEGLPFLETTYTDDAVNLGTTYYYVVTALDLSGNESDPSNEASATPEEFEDFPKRPATAFAHKLLFEEDGVLPSVEGAADGWAEDAIWNIGGDVPPSLRVEGGLLHFNSVLPGQQSITLQGASTWAAEVNSNTSYTFEVSLRVTAADAPNPGAILWLTNGSTRLILVVGVSSVSTFGGIQLDDQDNSTELVTIRAAYHAPTGLYFVWRNGELIGDSLPDDGAASGGRTAVFLIDCCSSVQAQGEFDYVCWDATGAYAPGEDDPRPNYIRGDTNADGGRNIADPVYLLNNLFGGGPPCPCQEACDVNDDGGINIADPVYELNNLFGGGPPIPAPGACGEAPTTADVFACDSFPPCGL